MFDIKKKVVIVVVFFFVETESEQTYKFSSNGYVSQFDYGQIIDINERQQNESEVVLVYPRDVLSFMELVTCLRRVLEKVFECKVVGNRTIVIENSNCTIDSMTWISGQRLFRSG